MKEVTDPELLKLLEGDGPASEELPPELLEQLNSTEWDTATMLGNVWPSAKRAATDIWTAISNPVDTAKGLGNLANSVGHKVDSLMVPYLPDAVVEGTNKAQNWMADAGLPLHKHNIKKEDMVYPNQAPAEAMGEFFDDRYGSWDKFKLTAMEDPVGLGLDASAVLSMGASALPKASKASQVGRVASGLLDPLAITMNAGKTGLSLLPESWPADMYGRAAKWSGAKTAPSPDLLTQTALDYDIKPNASGVGKVEMLIDGFNTRIEALINAAEETGARIPKSRVFQHLAELRQDMGGARLRGGSNRDTIDNIARDFDLHMKDLGKDYLTPKELQDFKKDIYEDNKYGAKTQQGTRIQEKTEKAFARAAKDEIEKVAPNVRAENEQLGRLLELEPELKKVAARNDRRNLVSLDSAVQPVAGGQLGGGPGAIAGAGLSLLSYPDVMSGLALGLNRAQRRGLLNMTNTYPLTMAAEQAAFQSGRMQDEGLLSLY